MRIQVVILLMIELSLFAMDERDDYWQKKMATIPYVNLSSYKIDKEEAMFIANVLKSNSTLIELNLSKNEINKEGALLIAQALKTNSTLKELDLSSNNLGSDGVKSIIDALKGNSTLLALKLNDNTIEKFDTPSFIKTLEKNFTIRTIYVIQKNKFHVDRSDRNIIKKLLRRNRQLLDHQSEVLCVMMCLQTIFNQSKFYIPKEIIGLIVQTILAYHELEVELRFIPIVIAKFFG